MCRPWQKRASPDQEADTLTGIVAPAGTPKEIVDQLQRDIAKIVAQPDVKAKLDALGFRPVANTPAQFAHADQGRDGKVGQGGACRQAEDRVSFRPTERGSKSDDEIHACDRARRGVSRFRFGVRPAISEQAGEDHHPVPGRRRDRSRRTADRAEAVGEARPAVLYREHRRRRRQSRHGAGRARAGRRLHRAAVVIERHGQPEPLQQDAVRRGEGSDPGHQGRRLAELLAGQSGLPGQER